ncbi:MULTISPECIES: restriction endonuclease subunit S [Psychrobacter]|jgi:type I restriction enzyme S subunit|uniref:restriction endonuclease subunit S n=1 Tax=Psychrobacter TaxID=497 RepID=UPI00191AEA80|nr:MULTISPECIES: restriction endonuclease subunit S [Psychrobacter]|tara:strand:- start:2761 stop:4047 length:1287 start_codon:yes stop_codon:yes gene_type:complete
MAQKYVAYPEYKESGVERLGQIPIDWKIFRLKNVLKIRNGRDYKEVEVESGGYPVYGSGGVFRRSSSYLYDGKSILFGRKGTIDKPLLVSGRFWTVDTMFYSEIYDNAIPEYIYYQSLSFPFSLLTTNTALPSMTQEDLLELDFVLPTLSEQIQIIDFLNFETARIDTLIDKQQTLIQLLKEKRQAVISHAVTKGLNPDAPMKDSGVEWLGEVPEHWGVKKNKHLLEFVTSGSRGWAGYYADEGNLFFRITNLTRDTIEPKLESIQNVKPPLGAEGERSKIQLDDLLISITADLGSVCVADNSISGGFVSQHVSLCRPNSSVKSARWLAYFILSDSAKEQFVGSGYGGTKIQLSLEDIRELNIAYPPKREQEDIASYIDLKLKKFELLMNQAEQAIQLMQERRTALISAAVTGEIDVRSWQVPNVGVL